jgi:hypothetical protein
VRHQLSAEVDFNAGNGGQETADLGSAGRISGAKSVDVESGVGLKHLLALQLLQVANSQLEDVSLFEFGDGLAFGLKGRDHEVFEVVEALVDAGTTATFEERLHDLAVLVGARHGGLVNHVVVVVLDGGFHFCL